MGLFKSKEEKNKEDRSNVAALLLEARRAAQHGSTATTKKRLEDIARIAIKSRKPEQYKTDLYNTLIPKSVEEETAQKLERSFKWHDIMDYQVDTASIEDAIEAVATSYREHSRPGKEKIFDRQKLRKRIYHKGILKPLHDTLGRYAENGTTEFLDDIENRIMHYAELSRAPKQHLVQLRGKIQEFKGITYARKAQSLLGEMIDAHKSDRIVDDLMPAVEDCVEQANTYIVEGDFSIQPNNYAVATDLAFRELQKVRFDESGVSTLEDIFSRVRTYAGKAKIPEDITEDAISTAIASIWKKHVDAIVAAQSTGSVQLYDQVAGFFNDFVEHYQAVLRNTDVAGYDPNPAELQKKVAAFRKGLVNPA